MDTTCTHATLVYSERYSRNRAQSFRDPQDPGWQAVRTCACGWRDALDTTGRFRFTQEQWAAWWAKVES